MGERLLIRRLVVLLAALVVSAASCTSGGSSDHELYAGEPTEGAEAGGSELSPEYLQGSPEDRASLQREEMLTIAECMQAEGFQFQVTAVAARPDDRRMQWLAAYDSGVEERRSSGFGNMFPAPSPPGEQLVDDPNRDYLAGLSAAEQAAFDAALFGSGKSGSVRLGDGTEIGFPLDGCVADARAKLFGDAGEYTAAMSIVDNLVTMIQGRVVGDQSFQKTATEWQSCITSKGFAVETLGELLNKVATESPRGADGTPSQTELTAAVADYECAAASGLIEVQRDLWQRAAAEVTDEFGDAIEDYRHMRAEAFRRLR